MALSVEIVTPAQVFSFEQVVSLTVDTSMGEIEILPNHRPLIATLEIGSARMRFADGRSESIAISSGILHLEADYVSLVVEQAIDVKKVEISEIDDAKTLAQQALKQAVDQGNLEQSELELLSAKVRSELLKKLKK